ncbi:hypothetical protein ACHAXT_004992 [Thalassiosira profunda]
MAVSTRHLHHRRLREGGDAPLGRSAAYVLDALSAEDSELARFLFVSDRQANNDGGGRCSRCRPRRRSGDDDMPRMNAIATANYSLALDPLAVRSEKTIMVAEAMTIFGALFLGGTFILFEWGSAKSYGGEGTNAVVDRLFAAVMAIAICCNIFLAFFGSFLWFLSILHANATEDFVLQSGKLMRFCSTLLIATLQTVTIGLFLGIYSNLSPHWAETIVVLVIAFVINAVGQRHVQKLVFDTSPIETYHLPLWARLLSDPACVVTHKGREELRLRAKQRAEEVKRKAYREREQLDPSLDADAKQSNTSIGTLLRKAAVSLGRSNYDTSIYEARLEEDWYCDASQLKGLGVEVLARYMPRLLAQRLHDILDSEEGTDFRYDTDGRPSSDEFVE